MNIRTLFFVALAVLCASCNRLDSVVKIEGKNVPIAGAAVECATTAMQELVERGKLSVDSVKAPIIGTAAITLVADRPESTLTNFAADALLHQAQAYSKEKIDIAVTNRGGLRSDLNSGAITFGDIYNVFPFENTLVTLTLNGEQLLRLFGEIARVGGEAISGARMEITRDADTAICTKLIVGDVSIPGDDKEWMAKEYRIATSDYLSQGNDGLSTLAEGVARKEYNMTIRQLMIEYIAGLHKKGESVNAVLDGRIKVFTRK